MNILSLILMKWAGGDETGAVHLLKTEADENLTERVRANLPPSQYQHFDELMAQE